MDGLPRGEQGKKSHYNGGQAVKLSPVQPGSGKNKPDLLRVTWDCGLPLRSLWGGMGGSGAIFSLRKKPLPYLVSILCCSLRPGLVLPGEAGPASASCTSAETGTWSHWGPPHWGPAVHPLQPSPVPQGRTRFPLPGGLCPWAGPCPLGCLCACRAAEPRSKAAL